MSYSQTQNSDRSTHNKTERSVNEHSKTKPPVNEEVSAVPFPLARASLVRRDSATEDSPSFYCLPEAKSITKTSGKPPVFRRTNSDQASHAEPGHTETSNQASHAEPGHTETSNQASYAEPGHAEMSHTLNGTSGIIGQDAVEPPAPGSPNSDVLLIPDPKIALRKENFFDCDHGVRYSILYELPYFNPLSHAIVEPMHNIFLGLLGHHGKDLFGLKISDNRKKERGFRSTARPAESDEESDKEDDPEVCGTDLGIVKQEDVSFSNEDNQPIEGLLAEFRDFDFAGSNSEPADSDEESNQSSAEEDDDDDCTDSVDDNIPTELNPLGAKFFGEAKNLEILREVNREFQLPSWIGRVPATFLPDSLKFSHRTRRALSTRLFPFLSSPSANNTTPDPLSDLFAAIYSPKTTVQ
ncbi:hypothetical protein PtA15_5A793 [Puccinia triticina]|uniref:Uncharacterized protein n=1 Tax=Puccinia triticina TaxID=208348 RepID=A0ABY7CJD0_9BASI|nr:uncharacterized protein PtA15_5A793 [Puccinia triticina]WAQ85219.1 hypothetical protein PtA15_5A793 [Puccinia triticina]